MVGIGAPQHLFGCREQPGDLKQVQLLHLEEASCSVVSQCAQANNFPVCLEAFLIRQLSPEPPVNGSKFVFCSPLLILSGLFIPGACGLAEADRWPLQLFNADTLH